MRLYNHWHRDIYEYKEMLVCPSENKTLYIENKQISQKSNKIPYKYSVFYGILLLLQPKDKYEHYL